MYICYLECLVSSYVRVLGRCGTDMLIASSQNFCFQVNGLLYYRAAYRVSRKPLILCGSSRLSKHDAGNITLITYSNC